MKHYYIVVCQSKINDRIQRKIIRTSRYAIIQWFKFQRTDILLSFTKISKAEAKYLGYKFDK